MNDEKLNKELEAYKDLGKLDKKIDVATLMINALQARQGNLLTDKEKHWGYLISLGVPPFGLIFAVKFYYSGKDDGKQAAWICALLTGASILSFVVIGKIILSSSGTSLNQIQQIKPAEVQQLIQ